MQQTHAEGSVRHAEKRRRGTCEFANRIARASLEAYDRSVPRSYREASKQTCVAAIVARFLGAAGPGSDGSCGDGEGGNRGGVGGRSHLQVMGLGVGTKFLSHAVIREEQLGTLSGGEVYGKRIRDCHAEILARRAFRRQIAQEMSHHLNQSKMGDRNGRRETGYIPILEQFERTDRDAKENDDGDNDGSDNRRIRFRLKRGVTLHFYASSAPCGNAVLKKFVKMGKEKFDESLGPDEWHEQVHPPVEAHSIRLGQFSLLVKKDGSIPRDINDSKQSPTREDMPERARKRRKPWPCREDDNWCPPACSIPHFDKGTIHSCSDKICRWNCLGVQGALLAPMLEGPLFIRTISVGRKFSKPICQRALCCRAVGFGTLEAKGSAEGNDVANFGSYKLNHPTLMETNVYMDDAGTHDMTGVRSVGRDARFDSNLCWVWWPDKYPDFGYAADCLDGKTGLKMRYDNGSGNVGQCINQDESSTCSTFGLLSLSLEVLKLGGVNKTMLPESLVTLADIRKFKRTISPEYESVKDEFFRHRVFHQWSCRDCR
ncbi:hypothetical protein ACHAWF_008020 [Thalassiosira exigua]